MDKVQKEKSFTQSLYSLEIENLVGKKRIWYFLANIYEIVI
jgi:hypothetical protein